MTVYIIYSGYHDAVLRIETNKNRAIDFAKQYVLDTEYESWVVEIFLNGWWDCDDLWSDDVIAHYTPH